MTRTSRRYIFRVGSFSYFIYQYSIISKNVLLTDTGAACTGSPSEVPRRKLREAIHVAFSESIRTVSPRLRTR